MTTYVIPEVRQCQDPKNIRGLFGTVAVESPKSNPPNWGYMQPQNGLGAGGGGWVQEDMVEDWPVIQERTEIEIDDGVTE